MIDRSTAESKVDPTPNEGLKNEKKVSLLSVVLHSVFTIE